MAYTAGYTPVLFKDKWEDRNNLPRIVDVELRILLWYEVAKISSWKYCNLLHRTVRFQGHVSTKHTFNCAAAFDTVEIYPELRMGWRSVRGVFIVSWGTLCKKWPCCCLCYSFFLMVNYCMEEMLLLFMRIVSACALAFHPSHLPHEGPDGVAG